jgi:hypothetical protein
MFLDDDEYDDLLDFEEEEFEGFHIGVCSSENVKDNLLTETNILGMHGLLIIIIIIELFFFFSFGKSFSFLS